MKRRLYLFVPLILFVCLAVILWYGIGSSQKPRASALISTPFPEFTLKGLDNPSEQYSSTMFKGHVTLVNVWGSWCPTCVQEMPQLLQLQQRGVRIVGVDYKDDRQDADQFLNNYGDPFQSIIADPSGSLGFNLGVYGAPESFIVDSNGVIRYHHTGYITPQDVNSVIMPTLKRIAE